MAHTLRSRALAWLEDSALNLAVFRVVVGAVILGSHSISSASLAAASLPAAVRTPPLGWGPIFAVVPADAGAASIAYAVLLGASVAGMLGLASRLSFGLVSISALYLWAIGQSAGHVFHYHHLWWFAVLLACSPCGDALSIDARLRPRLARRGIAYGIPIRAAWLLIGMIFFFPGLWKLLESGAEWFWSDNLRNQMYAKWLQTPSFTPLFRVDRYPMLLRVGALAVVLLELAFPLLVIFRRTRLFAALAALGFHLATHAFMNLQFPALYACYLVFIDWDRVVASVARRRRPVASPDVRPPRPWRAGAVAAAVLLVGNAAFGAAGVSDGWPLACYPKFHRVVAASIPDLRVEIVRADGRIEHVPDALLFPGGRSQRAWALVWSLLGAHERARASPERFAAFWRAVSARPALARWSEGSVSVRFRYAIVSTVPEDRSAPPLRERLLYEHPLRDPL